MKTKDMTTGNPIKLILAFAVPLFIGNVFQQVYSLVDTMVAGKADRIKSGLIGFFVRCF